MRIGIEIGGTFTDLVCLRDGVVTVAKAFSVPGQPDDGAFAVLDAAGLDPADATELAHGSTVATNAVLERKGARLALLATEGFGDLLLLRRQDRERIFDLFYRKPDPLVPRADTLEVPERMLADGSVHRPLDLHGFAEPLLGFLARGGYGAVAVCLLNSFANPAHERALAALLAERMPGLAVTCSVDVSREFREYERASTTAMAAYVQPVIDRYLGRLESRLAERGFAGRLSVMQSNGGRAPAQALRRNAVTALLSGPAAGVTGAVRQAGLSGVRDLVTLDIGGTSADVCLVQDGQPALTRDTLVADLPVSTPMVDINTVGAGGGSVVWVDGGGLLRVGPRSAGADPGPACYGRGGTLPTLTDAQVLCGRIRPDTRLAGSVPLDAAASRAAFAPLAAQLGMAPDALADSVVRIFVANVVSAIRLVSTRRGRDPRDYVLVPFGGAGPLHAAAVADALGIGTVLVPPNPGVLSAYGLLAADHSFYEGATRRIPVDADAPGRVRALAAELTAPMEARFAALGVAGGRRRDIVLDMRFVGQAFEVPVPLPPDRLDALTSDALLALFHGAYGAIYSFGAVDTTRAVEVVSCRVGLHVPQPGMPGLAAVRTAPAGLRDGRCGVVEDGRALDARLVTRAALGAGLAGPAVIEDTTATTWLPPGWHAAPDAQGNMILRRTA